MSDADVDDIDKQRTEAVSMMQHFAEGQKPLYGHIDAVFNTATQMAERELTHDKAVTTFAAAANHANILSMLNLSAVMNANASLHALATAAEQDTSSGTSTGTSTENNDPKIIER